MNVSKKAVAGIVTAFGLAIAGANVAAHPGGQGGMGQGGMRGMGHGMMGSGAGQATPRADASKAGCDGAGPGAMRGQHGRFGPNAAPTAQAPAEPAR